MGFRQTLSIGLFIICAGIVARYGLPFELSSASGFFWICFVAAAWLALWAALSKHEADERARNEPHLRRMAEMDRIARA